MGRAHPAFKRRAQGGPAPDCLPPALVPAATTSLVLLYSRLVYLHFLKMNEFKYKFQYIPSTNLHLSEEITTS
ncbi:unnamed protein product [Caretta caretta]